MTYKNFTHHIQIYVILSSFDIFAQVIKSEPYKVKHTKHLMKSKDMKCTCS
jgi:hypothetical protein